MYWAEGPDLLEKSTVLNYMIVDKNFQIWKFM